MKRIKKWLYEHFLPIVLRESLMCDNAKLIEKISQLQNENSRLLSYINGMETALRYSKRLTINTSEVNKQ